MDDLLQRVRRCEALQQPEYCENHYIHSFELENGRIKRNREFMNPMQKLRALGIAVPQIKRDGIPT
ncbi:PhzA/PhzB family protein [Pseudomonas aeruginosa]|uniref:PhzA/PhzB family protein n=1 Tax=Pseudomonas aeruginosa TaxID=287 RepID=UPI003BF5CC75